MSERGITDLELRFPMLAGRTKSIKFLSGLRGDLSGFVCQTFNSRGVLLESFVVY